jgi:5-hydroxyisourate hydrolase
MSSISLSTHVLDTAQGVPAAGVPVVLEQLSGDPGAWLPLADALTDADGRVGELVPPGAELPSGRYRVVFDLEAATLPGGSGWYPEVSIVIDLEADSGHAHVPLLLSPYGYTTYRGS